MAKFTSQKKNSKLSKKKPVKQGLVNNGPKTFLKFHICVYMENIAVILNSVAYPAGVLMGLGTFSFSKILKISNFNYTKVLFEFCKTMHVKV